METPGALSHSEPIRHLAGLRLDLNYKLSLPPQLGQLVRVAGVFEESNSKSLAPIQPCLGRSTVVRLSVILVCTNDPLSDLRCSMTTKPLVIPILLTKMEVPLRTHTPGSLHLPDKD